MLMIPPISTFCTYTTLFRSSEFNGCKKLCLRFLNCICCRVADTLKYVRIEGCFMFKGCFHRNALRKQEWTNAEGSLDRKSTRLNSSHSSISYAVFCLKKKRN